MDAMRSLVAVSSAALLALALPGCAGDLSEEDAAESTEAVTSGTPATVFTYNICGADPKCKVSDPTAAVLEHVVKDRPAAFFLQEVCEGQANAISRALRDKGLRYVQRFQNAASKKWNLGCGGFQGWGNVVFHVGDRLGEVKEGTFAAQDGWLTRAQNRGYVCVHVPTPDFWACTTHVDVKAEPQRAQLDEIARIVDGLAQGGGGTPVVVGGDFNVKPDEAALDGFYAPTYARGQGKLVEFDVKTDRTFAPAAASDGVHKIDYVFTTPDVTTTSSVVQNATSDHRVVRRDLVIPH